MADAIASGGDANAVETEGGTARILIADDHEIARRGIKDLFRGEASDGLDTLFKVRELRPDLLILDLSMPKMGGFPVAHRLKAIKSATKILAYSKHIHFGPCLKDSKIESGTANSSAGEGQNEEFGVVGFLKWWVT